MMAEVNRLFSRLRNRIFLMMARGIVKSIKDTEQTQLLQLKGLADETMTDIERLENYGIASVPLADAEAFIACLNGNRNQALVLTVHDRRYRPSYLLSGDVCLYTSQDKTADHRIHLTAGGVINIKGTSIDVTGPVTIVGDTDIDGDLDRDWETSPLSK